MMRRSGEAVMRSSEKCEKVQCFDRRTAAFKGPKASPT